MTKYEPYVSTLTPKLKEQIRQTYNFEYIKEIEDRIDFYNKKYKLIGGYHYLLAIKIDKTPEEMRDLNYILLKHKYENEISKYISTDSYMIKLD